MGELSTLRDMQRSAESIRMMGYEVRFVYPRRRGGIAPID